MHLQDQKKHQQKVQPKDLRELQKQLQNIEVPTLQPAQTNILEALTKRLRRRTPLQPVVGQLDASIQQFWKSQELSTFTDQRLACHGLLHPIEGASICLWESKAHLSVLLRSIEALRDSSSRFRRCYWGLLHAYFSIPIADEVDCEVENNRVTLRDFLKVNLKYLSNGDNVSEWITLLTSNKGLFDDHPCATYAEDLLNGDTSIVVELEATLKISPSSWFRSELLIAQVDHVINATDDRFVDYLPLILDRIAHNRVHRDSHFAHILDRYSELPNTPLHRSLRDNAVAWWGNPWLPTNQPNWARVTAATKRMVTTWLNTEFITAFFRKLSNDGTGDTRRAKFWLNYAPVMSSVHFGLTPQTLRSRDRDIMVLKDKLEGLWTMFRSSGSNNAFIMFLGPLVLVEFGDAGAVYGYDVRKRLPFDIASTLEEPKNIPNSLKHDTRVLWKGHGSAHWQSELAQVLRERFGILPYQIAPTSENMTEPRNVRSSTSPRAGNAMPHFDTTHTQGMIANSSVKVFTERALRHLAKRHGLVVIDERQRGGNLWVRVVNMSASVERELKGWGFKHKNGKGWWR
jgi:hypothetical protein